MRLIAPARSDVIPAALLSPQQPAAAERTTSLEAALTADELAALVVYYPWHTLAYNPPMTQGYHSSHPAYDWALDNNTPYYAPIGGVVKYAYMAGGYAYHVTVTNNDQRVQVLLAHMPANAQSRVGLSSGMTVKAGQLIGYSDNTGYSTGPHCHMEVRRPPYNGYASCIDYRQYLRTWTGTPTPPPPNPPPPVEPPPPANTTIKVGDMVHPVSGWRLRHGESATGQTLLVTGGAQVAWQLKVVRIAGTRAVFEVSIDLGGLRE